MSQADIDRKLARIKQAIKERQPDEARQLLIEVLKADPQNAEAWFVSSFLIKDPAAQLDAAQRALNINPNFAAAQKRLQELQTRQKGPTPLASVFDEELEESASVPLPPPPPATPAASVFNTVDDATSITPRPYVEDSPFEPGVAGETPLFDETRPSEATDVVTPTGVTRPTPAGNPSPFSDVTIVNQRLPFDETEDEAHASEKFPFDEPTAPPVMPTVAPSDPFDFDGPTAPPAADVFSFDNPPMPTIDSLSSFNPPPKIAATEGSFEDLLRSDPDSQRAMADADVLMMEDPLGSKSKAKRPKSGQKADHLALDKPYDPSVKQPKLASRSKGSRKAQKHAKAAEKRSQNNQALLILLLGLMLIFVLIAGAFLLLRPQINSLLGITPTETSVPVILPTSIPPTDMPPTPLPPTAIPTSPTGNPIPDNSLAQPTGIPTLTPTNAPPLAATTLPPTQTVTPSPPPATASPPGSAPPATAAPISTGVGSNAQATPNTAGDTQILAAFRSQINQARTALNSADFPPLGAANADQIVPLARIALPGLFSVLFHDGQPTLIFQISGYAARDSATFAIATLLDPQPLMRFSIQTASALGTVWLNRDQTAMISVNADKLTVIDPEDVRVLRSIPAHSTTSALSPDGHVAATASNNAAAVTLWNIDSGSADKTITLDGMTADRGPNSLVFSADSKVLAVGGCDGSIRLINVDSGAAKTIQPGSDQFDCFDVLSFTPNGAYVLASDNSGLGRYRAVDDSEFSNLTYAGLDANPRPKVALSADGSLIAGMNADFLLLWDFASGNELARRPISNATRVDGLTFSNDGQFVIAATHGAFTGQTWWGVASGALAAQATATRQAQTARGIATADALSAAMQGSGQLVFSRPVDDGRLGLFAVQPGAEATALLTEKLAGTETGSPFSLTADGQQMAFITPTGIAVAPLDLLAKLTLIAPSGERPVIAPNGQYVLFRQSDGQCSVSQRDGTLLPFLGDKVDCSLTAAVWSPDSQSLAVEQLYGSATRATQILLMQVAPSGVSAPVMVGPDSPRALDPAFRPNGQLTYLMFDVATKTYALFASAPNGKNAALLLHIPDNSTYHSHVWSPDGTRVALVEATDPEQVLVLKADGSLIARIAGDDLYTQIDLLAWSPDGRLIAASRGTRDQAQSRIFIYAADGSLSAPLTDGANAVWIP